MSLLDKFRNERKKKVDILSEPFNKQVIDLLMSYGIPPINARVCALEMVMATYTYYRKIKKSGKDATDEMVKELGDNLLKIIAHNGVTDPEIQDALLCQYFDILNAATGV